MLKYSGERGMETGAETGGETAAYAVQSRDYYYSTAGRGKLLTADRCFLFSFQIGADTQARETDLWTFPLVFQ
jgi:hypothetical protein